MRGDNHLLAVTTVVDEATNEVKPLFAFPVQVCKATADDKSPWENATPSGGSTDGLAKIDPVTGEAFTSDQQIKGIRIGDEFREIPQEAIEQINEATKIKTMVVSDRLTLERAWFKFGCRVTGNYFLQSPAKGGSHKAYRLTYEALREVRKGKTVKQPAQAIVVKRTARSRQALGFIYADEEAQCLRMVKVTFAAQQREPDAQVLAPQQAQVDEAAIEKVRKVFEVKFPGDGEQVLDTEVDEAVAMRAELVEKAIEGEAIIVPPKAVKETVEGDDLMGALEASLAG